MSTSMMVFGDRSDFAIQAMIEPDLIAPSTPWGRMCLWVQGISMGDIGEECCGLDQAFDSLAKLSDGLDDLWCEEFNGLGGLELINLLDGLLYGVHGDIEIEDNRSLEEIKADAERYWRFSILTNWGEQFDGTEKAFLFKPPGDRVKILSRAFPSQNGFCLSTTVETFHAVVEMANKWLEGERRTLNQARQA